MTSRVRHEPRPRHRARKRGDRRQHRERDRRRQGQRGKSGRHHAPMTAPAPVPSSSPMPAAVPRLPCGVRLPGQHTPAVLAPLAPPRRVGTGSAAVAPVVCAPALACYHFRYLCGVRCLCGSGYLCYLVVSHFGCLLFWFQFWWRCLRIYPLFPLGDVVARVGESMERWKGFIFP